jgi:hypothetical protein
MICCHCLVGSDWVEIVPPNILLQIHRFLSTIWKKVYSAIGRANCTVRPGRKGWFLASSGGPPSIPHPDRFWFDRKVGIRNPGVSYVPVDPCVLDFMLMSMPSFKRLKRTFHSSIIIVYLAHVQQFVFHLTSRCVCVWARARVSVFIREHAAFVCRGFHLALRSLQIEMRQREFADTKQHNQLSGETQLNHPRYPRYPSVSLTMAWKADATCMFSRTLLSL